MRIMKSDEMVGYLYQLLNIAIHNEIVCMSLPCAVQTNIIQLSYIYSTQITQPNLKHHSLQPLHWLG